MTTSANSIEYTITDKSGKDIGHFRKNVMCRLPDYAELLKYQPLADHTIQEWGYDEEEDMWEEEPENLEKFLKPMIPFNKKIREFFNGEKTVEQIMQEFEEERLEDLRKMKEYFAKEREKIINEHKLKNGKA
jgi:hypothetical protein